MFQSLKDNLKYLKKKFNNSADFTVRNITLISPKSTTAAVITMEGMCNKEGLAITVINPLISEAYSQFDSDEIFDFVCSSVLSASEMVEINSFEEVQTFIMSGFAVIAIDGCERMAAIGIQGFSFRSVSEPETEVVQRGSREGFVEPLRINMTLIRRRMKNPDMVFETMTVGEISQTQLCLCYLQSSVSSDILKVLKKRLKDCDLPTVISAGYLVSYLEDKHSKSLLSGIGVSERPDTVCGKITEGRVAVLVDGTPSVLIIPHLFVEDFQSIDDYSNRPYYASFTRILKYLSFFVSIYLPSLYVAFAAYHPEYFPTQLLKNVISSVYQTPLPLVLEVLLIHFIYEIMREAGLRIPKPLGHAVGIVGALVIGESAVSAGIIGSPTLMVVAISAICGYVIPTLNPTITIFRFTLIVIGGIFGVWGIALASCMLLVNMCAKTSFGVPYLSPIAPFGKSSMRDVFIRCDWRILSKKQNMVQNMPGTGENYDD